MQYDLKKLKTSIIYIDRLCQGHHPRYNTVFECENIINNPDVIRCMFFIKEILKNVEENNGYIEKKETSKKEEFPFPILKEYKYKEDLFITKFIEELNNLALKSNPNIQKIKYTKVLTWLKNNKYLEIKHVKECNQESTVVTKLGQQVGIYNQVKNRNDKRKYLVVLYNKDAQEFIINNMENILKIDDE